MRDNLSRCTIKNRRENCQDYDR